jgi:hypothetical protein
MLASLLVLADAASEGKSIVLMMLATALVFIAVIAIGDLSHVVAARRRAKKTRAL